MKRKILYGSVGAFIFMIVGFLVGTSIGGNYFTDFRLWTWVGYEATGWIGIIVGALLGAIIGIALSNRTARIK